MELALLYLKRSNSLVRVTLGWCFVFFWMLDFEGRTYPRWDCAPGEMGEFFIDPIWNSFWDLLVYEDPIDCEPDTWFSAVPIVFMVFNDVFSGEVLNCFKS